MQLTSEQRIFMVTNYLRIRSLNLNKDLSGRRRTERTQENTNLLQEKLIEDTRISARKNGSEISKSTFNRITKRDLKWHNYKRNVRKERKKYKLS